MPVKHSTDMSSRHKKFATFRVVRPHSVLTLRVSKVKRMSNSMNFPIPEPSLAKSSNLADILSQKVVGQAAVMQCIVPYVQMYQAGLATAGRPAGVFLLLGPTGTGKTRTVEVLAETLHGSDRHLLKVDCGEFQMEHEVAKLIGAPPGYLGHRETPPLLTQQ